MTYIKNYFKELRVLLKENIRDYGMFIALGIIMIIFAITSGGLFLGSRNISNLLNQTGYIGVLSVGMTLVIIIRHIDLSVGYVSGFIGALSAILIVQYNLPALIAIFLVTIVGIFIGLWHGFLVAYMKLPAFVATLAGMFIFRGAIQQTLRGTGTIIIDNDLYRAISNGYIPDIASYPNLHVLTLILGIVGVLIYIIFEIRNHRIKKSYDFEVLTKPMLISKIAFIGGLVMLLSVSMATHRGMPWTMVIVFTVVLIYHIMMNNTILGRNIYAVGGNPEAAELSGISVKKITLFVFASMGFLSALSGIMFASRLQSATVTAGRLFELEAIAGAFVGGVSATGGIGKVTGSLIGAFVMASLTSGMNLMGVGSAVQFIVKGAVLVIAVIFDVRTRKEGK